MDDWLVPMIVGGIIRDLMMPEGTR
jgi:hypothetical protein